MIPDGFPRLVIVYGVGLIGSSFAMALKIAFPGVRLFGIDAPDVLERARTRGVVERGEPSPSEAADLTILAAPVGAILDLIDKFVPGPRLVMDVGSTKVEICLRAERRGLPFVGGHPVTGLERSGPEGANPELFKGTPFFLCPVSTTPRDAVALLQTMLERVGAIPHVIKPDDHDRLVAQLSHLPQILSTVLADHASFPQTLAGPGWKSVTRLAASPFHVWGDILKTSGFLPQEIRLFLERLQAVLHTLEAGKVDEIRELFERANRRVSGGEHE
jgi:prephenate dehydrogenase